MGRLQCSNELQRTAKQLFIVSIMSQYFPAASPRLCATLDVLILLIRSESIEAGRILTLTGLSTFPQVWKSSLPPPRTPARFTSAATGFHCPCPQSSTEWQSGVRLLRKASLQLVRADGASCAGTDSGVLHKSIRVHLAKGSLTGGAI